MRVGKDQHRPRCNGGPGIARGGNSQAFSFAEQPHIGPKVPLTGAIRRAVVDENDLQRAASVFTNRFEGSLDFVPLVVRRDDDTDRHGCPHRTNIGWTRWLAKILGCSESALNACHR